MTSIFKKFYRSFYLNTGGYIPSIPLNESVYPGDFFQIKNGEIVILGNIFKTLLIANEDIDLTYDLELSAVNWNLKEGVKMSYSGRENGNDLINANLEYNRQIMSFASYGSFLFNANNPKSVKISNWNTIAQELIIKLTQTHYSFREVYVVTESVSASHWTLAISEEEKAELEIANQQEDFGLVDIFGHHETKTISSKDIGYHHFENKRVPRFFKAKKLAVQNDKLDIFVANLIQEQKNKDNWALDFFDEDYANSDHVSSVGFGNVDSGSLDMIPAKDLNPNTVLNYFKWDDANLDDIQKLFLSYDED